MSKSLASTLIYVSLFFLSLFLFTYNIGSQSLHPWDEAWFATIAQNILSDPNPLAIQYNSEPFWDHPPLGFYLTAFSFSVGGINEFSARLPSSIAGSLAIAMLFLTGQALKNSTLGISASLILLSSRWFILRSRTGNLDSLLLLTQLTTFYFASTATTKNRLYLAWFFFALALLSKTTISLMLTPLMIIATLNYHRRHQVSASTLITTLAIFLAPMLPWYGYNLLTFGPPFLKRHFFQVGLRRTSLAGVSVLSVQQTLLYLRSAVHKWYLPLLASTGLSLFSLKSKPIRWLLAYLILTTVPFFLSTQTEIWHLIPLMAPMALLIPLVSLNVVHMSLRLFHFNPAKKLVPILMLMVTLVISLVSWQSYWGELIATPPAISDAAHFAMQASHYPGYLIVKDLDDFYPTIAFYSQKPLLRFRESAKKDNFAPPYQIITHQDYLKDKTNYRILYQRDDKVLALFP